MLLKCWSHPQAQATLGVDWLRFGYYWPSRYDGARYKIFPFPRELDVLLALIYGDRFYFIGLHTKQTGTKRTHKKKFPRQKALWRTDTDGWGKSRLCEHHKFFHGMAPPEAPAERGCIVLSTFAFITFPIIFEAKKKKRGGEGIRRSGESQRAWEHTRISPRPYYWRASKVPAVL